MLGDCTIRTKKSDFVLYKKPKSHNFLICKNEPEKAWKDWDSRMGRKSFFSPMERNIWKESILFKKNKKPQFLICKTLFQGLKTKRFGQQNG